MINWRKVTEMEPKPGHDGYVLLLDNVEKKVFCGWRKWSGKFYDNRDPEWWAPLNLPGEGCDETGDEKEDRVVALERRVAALENAREVTAATGWAVVDADNDPFTYPYGFTSRLGLFHEDVIWFHTHESATALAVALGNTPSLSSARAALLDKETLEEVAAK